MQFDLKLKEKLLICLGVPMLLQLLLAASVFFWNSSGEKEIEQLRNMRAGLTHLESARDRLVNLELLSLISLKGERLEELTNSFEGQRSDVERELNDATKFVSEWPTLKNRMESLRSQTTSALEKERHSLGTIGDTAAQGRIVNQRFRPLSDSLDTTVSELNTLRNDLYSYGIAYRKVLSTVLNALVVAIPIASIVMGAVILFDVLPRLKVLIANVGRFATREPLQPVARGRDELAELGEVLAMATVYLTDGDAQRVLLYSTVRSELRTPLVNLKYSLYLLRQGILGDFSDRAGRKLEAADEEVARLVRLVSDLLNTDTKADAGYELTIKKTGTETLAESALYAVQGMADATSVELEKEVSNLMVNCDPDRISQVLVNFLSNAIKFSPPGKRVTLRITALPEGVVEFRVIDRGRGVPLDAQKSIFERFMQVEKSDARDKGGTGLGLSICRAIVEQHGGTIGVSSKPKEGSEFWFRLPL